MNIGIQDRHVLRHKDGTPVWDERGKPILGRHIRVLLDDVDITSVVKWASEESGEADVYVLLGYAERPHGYRRWKIVDHKPAIEHLKGSVMIVLPKWRPYLCIGCGAVAWVNLTKPTACKCGAEASETAQRKLGTMTLEEARRAAGLCPPTSKAAWADYLVNGQGMDPMEARLELDFLRAVSREQPHEPHVEPFRIAPIRADEPWQEGVNFVRVPRSMREEATRILHPPGPDGFLLPYRGADDVRRAVDEGRLG